jgi:ribosomal protein S18 acetylase RimI-like enzyme
MSNDPTVRNASPSDALVISRLIAALASGLAESSPATPHYVADVLQRGACQVLLAEREGTALGVLSYYFHPSLYHAADSCLIEELVVAPEARRQGVGTVLLEEAIRRARERGCVEVSLGVMRNNKDAQRFYERHGFEADALLMERHLTAE